MRLKTVTRNIAFALLAVAMTGVVISSCSTDEYDDCGLTMAKRKTSDISEHNPMDALFGDTNTIWIPDELIGSCGCGYKSIHQVFGEKYTLDSIKSAMIAFDSIVDYYPPQHLASAICQLTRQVVAEHIGNGATMNISVGDIICLTPEVISRYTGKNIITGHATVVVNLEKRAHFTRVICYDGVYCDNHAVSRVIKTSSLQ